MKRNSYVGYSIQGTITLKIALLFVIYSGKNPYQERYPKEKKRKNLDYTSKNTAT